LKEEGCGIGVGEVSQKNCRRWRGIDKRGFEAEKAEKKEKTGQEICKGRACVQVTSQFEVGAKFDSSPADNTILQQNKTIEKKRSNDNKR
jgi:hypothetical protein